MKRKFLSFYLALAAVVLFGGLAQAQQKFTAALNSMQIVPSDNSPSSNLTARGSCKASLVQHPWDIYYQPYLTVTCEFSGLSGGLTGADIRVASAGQNGDSLCMEKQVMVSLPNAGNGTVSITCSAWDYWGSIIQPYLLLEKRLYIVLQTANSPEEVRGQIKPVTLDSDIDGEGRAEISVFRPNDSSFYAYCSMNESLINEQLGWQQTDSTPFLADFDGDGIAERAFIRTNSTNGIMTFIYTRSSDNRLIEYQWGNTLLGDIPAYGDFDGNGAINIAVFRASTGVWWGVGSISGQVVFGQAGDEPCPGDYDGDGKTDLCVIREENGQFAWHIRSSWNSQTYKILWGLSTDTFYPNNPVDIDADGANDILVSRETNGRRYFYALRSSDNSLFALLWGLSTDQVKLGDYDADGKTDFAAIREINNQLVWFIYESSNRQMRSFNWGLPGDK